MFTAKVIGNVVATQKDEKLVGSKLLVVSPLDKDLEETEEYHVAVDSVGAGTGETVLVTRGSAARRTQPYEETPVDLAIVGIVDEIDISSQG